MLVRITIPFQELGNTEYAYPFTYVAGTTELRLESASLDYEPVSGQFSNAAILLNETGPHFKWFNDTFDNVQTMAQLEEKVREMQERGFLLMQVSVVVTTT